MYVLFKFDTYKSLAFRYVGRKKKKKERKKAREKDDLVNNDAHCFLV